MSSNGTSEVVPKPPQIAIIGGGVAGMLAAITLSRIFTPSPTPAPFITILEGRSRLGGRLAQTVLPGTNHVVDLGPNWIHGTEHNPILDLAEELGEVTHSFGDEGDADIFDDDGKHLEPELAKEISETMWSIVVDAFARSRQALEGEGADEISEVENLRAFVLEKLKEKFDNKDDKAGDRKGVLIEQLARMWGAFVGSDYRLQSLKWFWLEECLDGENVFLASTYTKILESITEKVMSDPNITIKFSTTINNISYSITDPHVTLTTATTLQPSHFDEVIVTTPLGWLKRNLSAFSPSLPSDLQSSIMQLGYGNLEKVFFTFPTAWWENTGDPPLIDKGAKNAFSTFLCSDTTEGKPQIIQSIALSSLPGSNAHPTLLFYIFGSHAQEIARRVAKTIENTSQQVDVPSSSLESTAANSTPQIQAILEQEFNSYLSLLPNHSPTSPSCKPISSYFTNWTNDDLAGNGSYSNFQIVSSNQNDSIERQDLAGSVECIRKGVPEQGLWFAGEHTAPFVGLGTVTGAWWSGEGVAKRVAVKYGVLREDDVENGEDGQKGKEGLNGEGVARGVVEM